MYKDKTELLIGKWVFVKAFDNSRKKINFIERESKFGLEMDKISGPNLEFKSNNECIREYNQMVPLVSSWEIQNEDLIVFVSQNQKSTKKKMSESYTQKIESLTKNKLVFIVKDNLLFKYRKN